MATTPCWRICEVGPTGRYLTLMCAWRGSRHLPLSTTMKAEPFTKVLNGRTITFVGFHVYTQEELARQMLERMDSSKRFAVLYCEGTGIQPAFSEPGLYLANELKMVSQVAQNY